MFKGFHESQRETVEGGRQIEWILETDRSDLSICISFTEGLLCFLQCVIGIQVYRYLQYIGSSACKMFCKLKRSRSAQQELLSPTENTAPETHRQ